MDKVSILLATYNGGKYIEQQLLSLIGQNYKGWRLFVRDDGSTDDTVELVRHYSNIDSRIVLVKDSLGSLGCINNFLALLPYSDTCYTIFCDQDDIWLENKLEVLVAEMDTKDDSIPQLVYCGAYSYHTKQGVAGEEIITKVDSVESLLFRAGGIQGCSSLFNRKLKEKLMLYKGDTIMHDFTVAFIAVVLGETTLVNKPLMLYRQHDSNVTGYRPKNLREIKFLFFSKWRDKGILNLKTYRTIKQLTECFRLEIAPEKMKLITIFLKFPEMSRARMVFTVLRYRFNLYGKSYPIVLKILTRKLWDTKTTFL